MSASAPLGRPSGLAGSAPPQKFPERKTLNLFSILLAEGRKIAFRRTTPTRG
jgi:hypothetical protein